MTEKVPGVGCGTAQPGGEGARPSLPLACPPAPAPAPSSAAACATVPGSRCPGEGPGPALPWEAGPCGQEGVPHPLPGPGKGAITVRPHGQKQEKAGSQGTHRSRGPVLRGHSGDLPAGPTWHPDLVREVPLFPGGEQFTGAVLCVGPGSPPEDASLGRAPPLPSRIATAARGPRPAGASGEAPLAQDSVGRGGAEPSGTTGSDGS